MKRKFAGKLPQKNLGMKLKFEEPVFCALKASLTGKTKDTATEEEKKANALTECSHQTWPTFWPQCIDCIAHNKFDKYLSDKKGREYRVVTPASPASREQLAKLAEDIKESTNEPTK